MRKSHRSLAALLLSTFLSVTALSQSTITGNIRNSSNKEVLPAVSIVVKGGTAGRILTKEAISNW
jgi:hypothetical protein